MGTPRYYNKTSAQETWDKNKTMRRPDHEGPWKERTTQACKTDSNEHKKQATGSQASTNTIC